MIEAPTKPLHPLVESFRRFRAAASDAPLRGNPPPSLVAQVTNAVIRQNSMTAGLFALVAGIFSMSPDKRRRLELRANKIGLGIILTACAIRIALIGWEDALAVAFVSGCAAIWCAKAPNQYGALVNFIDSVLSYRYRQAPARPQQAKSIPPPAPVADPTPPLPPPDAFSAYLGCGTGLLAQVDHVASIGFGQGVKLGREDILRSFAFIGEPGSGKTTGGILPLTAQLIEHGAGLCVIDGKNDIGPAILHYARELGRPAYRIGVRDGAFGFNLFEGLHPDQVTDVLRQVFLITGAGGGTSNDGFFTTQALLRCNHALGLLAFFPEHYSIVGLDRFVFEDQFRDEIIAKSARMLDAEGLGTDVCRILKAHLDYELYKLPKMLKAENTAGAIFATIQNLFMGFTDPDLIDAFCSSSNDQARLSELNYGAVFFVDLPLARYGIAALLIFLFVKEAIFRMVKGRAELPDEVKRIAPPIGLVCDEYQKITGGASDLNAVDTMRSLGGFLVAGFQSVSALRAAIRDDDTVTALLGNLVQKIIFSTSDVATIEYASRIAGTAQNVQETLHFGATQGFAQHPTQRTVVDAQLFADLRQSARITEGVALLRIGGAAYHDVLQCFKVFPSDF